MNNIATASVVDIVNPIEMGRLSHLMEEYTKRLNSKVASWFYMTVEKHPADSSGIPTLPQDTVRDILYLERQMMKLINKASAQRENQDISEADKFEIELRLFDAENAIRDSKGLRRYTEFLKFARHFGDDS